MFKCNKVLPKFNFSWDSEAVIREGGEGKENREKKRRLRGGCCMQGREWGAALPLESANGRGCV